ncbi:helix-turn-helix transcriptional regulator [Paenibacillus sp. FSL R5-0636]|uniref:helix-turn-helix domain-containing protein n=2 Tax=Paenibacillus TaxID=44249 RepID=UPI002116A02B|nr:helix-turn-helix transcriptional regulator [Paenibacillus odorifer]
MQSAKYNVNQVMRMFSGNRLRKLRKNEDLTMKEFGAKFSLAESTISGYENESRKPDLDTVNKFADYFNVSADYLMGRTDRLNLEETNLSFYGGPDKYTPDEIEEMEAALARYRKNKKRIREEMEDRKK